MCDFFSAIVLKNGDVLLNPYTDSHEELIKMFNLRDNRLGNFARVEFKPPTPEGLTQPDLYKLRIDEEAEPDWFDEAMKEKTTEHLRGVIKRMIIDSDAAILCGGVYILIKGARVDLVKAARIVVLSGGTVQRVESGAS